MRVPSLLAHAVACLAVSGVVASCELAGKLDGLQGGCPPMPGRSQVKITSAQGDYCVDVEEVTNDDYARFLAAAPTLPAAHLPGGCTAGESMTPSKGWPIDPGYEDFPVAFVDWCQASALCQWEGKRLCGAIGGGPLASVNSTKAAYSQWLNACSNGGSLTYPYGDTYAAAACASGTSTSIVGSHPACVGGFPGLYDMSGNVWEWTDNCASSEPDDFCFTYGGAFDSLSTELTCVSERNWTRTSGAADIGVRCCFDL